MAAELGAKIRELRKSKGLTLEELAKRSDASKSYIWELENRTPPRPSAEKLRKIAEQLGVTLGFLIGEEDSIEDAEDTKFYREYKKLTRPEKEKVRKMMDLFCKEDGD
jgi:transcriptional regulator with XRE-family HTH domain